MRTHYKLGVVFLLIGSVSVFGLIGFDYFSSSAMSMLLSNLNNRNPASENGLEKIKLPWGIAADKVPYVKYWGDYLEAIGIKTGRASHSKNTSLIEFNQKRFDNNPCFARLAGYFYDEIQREDLRFYAQNNFENKKLRAKASIADMAGQGVYASVKPGWLWETALKFALGDKNLAFQLIGVCGHDDSVPDANVHFPELSYNAETRRSKYLDFYKSSCQSIEGNSCERAMRTFQERSCPNPTSRMFLPKSLGPEADIDQNLKNRIASVQAPTMGATVIPAKYYHVLGSAFTACLALERCPDSSILCSKFFSYGQTLAINIYRGVQICGDVNFLGIGFAGKSPKDYQILFKNKFPEGSKVCDSKVDTPKVEGMIEKISASDCPKEWDKARCDKALLKLQTLKVDFEWSRSEHDKGYEFAKNNCPSIGNTKDPLEKSCAAVKNIEENLAIKKEIGVFIPNMESKKGIR